MGLATHRYGPVGAALAGTRGRSLAPDAPSKSLGDVAPGATATVAYTLRNLTGRPIRLQGARSSCSCSVVEGIPRVIDAGGMHAVTGVVHAGNAPGRFDGSFTLFTDDDVEPQIQLGYSGRVVGLPAR